MTTTQEAPGLSPGGQRAHPTNSISKEGNTIMDQTTPTINGYPLGTGFVPTTPGLGGLRCLPTDLGLHLVRLDRMQIRWLLDHPLTRPTGKGQRVLGLHQVEKHKRRILGDPDKGILPTWDPLAGEISITPDWQLMDGPDDLGAWVEGLRTATGLTDPRYLLRDRLLRDPAKARALKSDRARMWSTMVIALNAHLQGRELGHLAPNAGTIRVVDPTGRLTGSAPARKTAERGDRAPSDATMAKWLEAIAGSANTLTRLAEVFGVNRKSASFVTARLGAQGLIDSEGGRYRPATYSLTAKGRRWLARYKADLG
jgi:predicted transcriptional regulator